MGLLSKISSDKFLLILFLVVVLLGIFIRLDNTSEVGYWVDDQAALPAGLMWFYPHSYFPGLNYGNPPLGDLIIGAGCMLSGEDFSAVSQVRPFFYPDRFDLLGEPLAKANFQCHLPMYIFGLIFFIGAIIFAFTFFGRYSALFLTSFISFHPTVLKFSRWIKVDVIFWVFIIFFLYFLMKFYQSKKENTNLTFSAIFLGLSFATKFTGAMFFFFAMVIMLDKYKQEFLSLIKIICKKLNLTLFQSIEYISPKKLIYQSSLFTIIFAFIALIPFKLNPMNILATRAIYQQFNGDLGKINLKISTIFRTLQEFALGLNVIDTILLLFSIYLLFRLLRQVDKTKIERFILYLILLFVITTILFPVLIPVARSFPFLLGVIFLISLAFSNRDYSLFNLFKIKNKKTFFLIFIVIYLIFSSFVAFSASPYFTTKNDLACTLMPNNSYCTPNFIGFESRALAEYLAPLMTEEETFMGYAGILFFHIRPEQGLIDYHFDEGFRSQVGRYSTFLEKAQYYRPSNRTIRYIVLPPDYKGEDEATRAFIEQAKPIKRLELKGSEVAIIYDLKNLE